jgi:hypothetical protein
MKKEKVKRINCHGFTKSDWQLLQLDLDFKLFMLFHPSSADIEHAGIETMLRRGVPALL